jgi:hypothetical protein
MAARTRQSVATLGPSGSAPIAVVLIFVLIAQNHDIAKLCGQLRQMEKQLADHGFTESDVSEAQVKKAKEYIRERVRTLEDFERVKRELEAKVHEITGRGADAYNESKADDEEEDDLDGNQKVRMILFQVC